VYVALIILAVLGILLLVPPLGSWATTMWFLGLLTSILAIVGASMFVYSCACGPRVATHIRWLTVSHQPPEVNYIEVLAKVDLPWTLKAQPLILSTSPDCLRASLPPAT
jgi:uncharacterized membrane protein